MMTEAEVDGPNAEQIRFWNEQAGPRWVAMGDRIDAHIRPFGVHAMEAAALRVGDCVLDIGCGCGQTTRDVARCVAPSGIATGVDISGVMLERARAAAREGGVVNVHFEQADAQVHRFAETTFDVLYSRFGVMFFSDPVAAFTNLHGALRPGGRLAFVCWQSLQENPWMFVPLAAAAQHIQLPVPAGADAPGPFAFADAQRVRRILQSAGFHDIECAAVSETLAVGGGGGLDETVDFLMQLGPTSAALRDVTETQRAAVFAAVRAALAAYETPAGVCMPGSAWIVTARAAKRD